MKRFFEEPAIEIHSFVVEDVITSSMEFPEGDGNEGGSIGGGFE